MNLSKSREFFNPDNDSTRVHIIGCGSVGSTIAENLVRCGVTKITLWDFDKVEAHNMCNQMFREKDIGKLKVEALADILKKINPEVAEKGKLKLRPAGWWGENIQGYVFLAVDNIELRRKIVKKHMDSVLIKAMFDFRTGLEEAQHFAADWTDTEARKSLLDSMQFSHEEAKAEAPVSACGRTLGVVTTVRLISAYGVNNYINFVKGNGYWKFVYMNGFKGILNCV